MKEIIRHNFQDLVDSIEFPTIVYIFETGKVICMNEYAKEIIGATIRNISKLQVKNHKFKISEETLDSGSKIFYNVKFEFFIGGVQEIDIEVNSLFFDNMHTIIAFFDFSYKQRFIRHMMLQIPRLAWTNKTLECVGMNEWFRRDCKLGNEVELPLTMEEVFDDITSEKLIEDNESILDLKEGKFHELQLLKTKYELGNFCMLDRIPLLNKNGTAIGILGVYHLILNREEYKRLFDYTLRENTILNRMIYQSDIVVVTWRKDIDYTIEYVSTNVNRFGYHCYQIYNREVVLKDFVSDREYKRFLKQLEALENGKCDSFDIELQLVNTVDIGYYLHMKVEVERRTNRGSYYQCLIKDITEKRALEEKLHKYMI